MRALNRVFKGRARGDQPTLPAKVKRILLKYGATLLMPGPAGILQYGFQPGNYRESTGQSLAAVDQQVGLVVDAANGNSGAETIFNGNFATGNSGWSVASGFSFTGGALTINASGGATTNNSGTPAVAGTLYYCEVVVSSFVSGQARLNIGGVNGVPLNAAGEFRFFITANTNANPIIYCTSSGTSLVLSRVSAKAVSGIHASQSTSGFQPYLRQSGGVNSWQFDGVDDRLSLSAVPFLITDDFWAVCAYTNTNAVGDAKLLSLRSTTDVNPLIELAIEGRNPILQIRNNAGILSKISSPAVPVSTPAVVSAVKRASTANLRVDGVQNPSSINLSSIGALTLNGAAICASGSGTPASFLEGRMHGLAIGKGGITPTELLTLENFIARLQGRNL